MDENIYGLMKFYTFHVWKNLTRTTAARIEGKKVVFLPKFIS